MPWVGPIFFNAKKMIFKPLQHVLQRYEKYIIQVINLIVFNKLVSFNYKTKKIDIKWI
jgi:hypothetical protein